MPYLHIYFIEGMYLWRTAESSGQVPDSGDHDVSWPTSLFWISSFTPKPSHRHHEDWYQPGFRRDNGFIISKGTNNFQELEALAQKSLDIAVDTQYIMKTHDAINEIRKLFQ